MGQIVEAVFENLRRGQAAELVSALLASSAKVIDVTVDGERMDLGRELRPTQFKDADWSFIRLPTMRLRPDFEVANVGIRMVNHAAGTDVELSTDLDDVAQPRRLQEALFERAKALATAHGVESYFAGLEPAADEATRIFTRETLGPTQL